MVEKINVVEAMRETPRPHYLVGDGELVEDGGSYTLRTTVRFSSEGNPSVSDRKAGKYLSRPHVNAGDANFAFWNAAHIIADRLGCKARTLRKGIVTSLGREPILPDRDYGLVMVMTPGEIRERRGRRWNVGELKGTILNGDEPLMRVKAGYYAEL